MTADPRTILDRLPMRSDVNDAVTRLDQLEAIETWAIAHLPVQPGQPVVLQRIPLSERSTPHWWRYREALHTGMGATVTGIHFTLTRGWVADVLLDREWSTTDTGAGTTRLWRGPGTPPDGYRDGRRPGHHDERHTWTIPVDQLQAVETAVAS